MITDETFLRLIRDDTPYLTERELAETIDTELENAGISPVTLPELLVSEDCGITQIEYLQSNEIISANISFVYGRQQGSIYISRVKIANTSSGAAESETSKTGEPIRVESMEVYVFEQEGKNMITYCDALSQYAIYLPFTVEDTMELAKTLTKSAD